MVFKDLKYIIKHSSFHSRIIKTLLYLEKRCRIKLFFKILRKLIIQCGYLCEIHPDSFRTLNAIVTLKMPHPYFIVIHKETSIGEHCKIYQGVTIGSTEKEGEYHNLAYIGDNVLIGVKSTILGDVRIGNNVKIGAHALVLKDVDDGKTVVGLWK